MEVGVWVRISRNILWFLSKVCFLDDSFWEVELFLLLILTIQLFRVPTLYVGLNVLCSMGLEDFVLRKVLVNTSGIPSREKKKSWFVTFANFCVANAPWLISSYQCDVMLCEVGKGRDNQLSELADSPYHCLPFTWLWKSFIHWCFASPSEWKILRNRLPTWFPLRLWSLYLSLCGNVF